MFIEKSKARITTFFLGGLASSLVVASILGQAMYYLPHHNRLQLILSTVFYVDRERNIPTTFACMLLLFASILLFVIAINQIKQKLSSSHWFVLSAGFFVMAIDEMFSFHERLMEPVKTLLNLEEVALFRHAWVIPGTMLILLLIPYFWNFLHQLPSKTARMFIIAASLYLGGAIGIEMIGGYYASTHAFNFTYTMIATIEESLEMAGVILFIRELMIFISDLQGLDTRHHSETEISV